MLFDNPIFSGWYTDTVDIYRVVTEQQGNISSQVRNEKSAQHQSRAVCIVPSVTVRP